MCAKYPLVPPAFINHVNGSGSARRRAQQGAPDRLEVVFRNDGEITIPLTQVEIRWKFDPPRKAPTPTNQQTAPKPKVVSVQEVEGAVTLSCDSVDRSVAPGQEKIFYLAEDMVAALVVTLADDVHDDGILINFHTKSTLGWTAAGDEIPTEVRAVAESVVALWDSE